MNRLTTLLTLWLFTWTAISGCDGGLTGTSTGPTNTPHIPRLPKKISPLLPDTIKSKSNKDGQLNDSPDQTTPINQPQVEARSWSIISPSLQQLDSTRITVQEILTLIDHEYAFIAEACGEQLLNNGQCTLADGEIEATYNHEVTQSMVAIHSTASADTPATSISENTSTQAVRNYYQALEGSTVVFNSLTLVLPPAAGSVFTLTTSSDDLLRGKEVSVSWNAAHDQIDYEVNDLTEARDSDRYNYRNTAAGQRLTVSRDQLNDHGALDSSSFEFTTQPVDNGEIYYNARIDNYHISGQANEQHAFAYNRSYDLDAGFFLQEVFDEEGYLIVFEECEALDEFYCEAFEQDDEHYELYISPADLDIAYSELGFSDVYVTNLPPTVEEFLILENEPGMPLWMLEEYCEGWQPAAGEIELFCFVPNEELDDAIVVSADGETLELLPDTNIIAE